MPWRSSLTAAVAAGALTPGVTGAAEAAAAATADDVGTSDVGNSAGEAGRTGEIRSTPDSHEPLA
jgi:hypothetical protein